MLEIIMRILLGGGQKKKQRGLGGGGGGLVVCVCRGRGAGVDPQDGSGIWMKRGEWWGNWGCVRGCRTWTDWVRWGRTTTSTLSTECSRSRWCRCRRSTSTRAAAAAGGGQVRLAGEIWGDGVWQQLQSGDVGRDKAPPVAPGPRHAGKLPPCSC